MLWVEDVSWEQPSWPLGRVRWVGQLIATCTYSRPSVRGYWRRLIRHAVIAITNARGHAANARRYIVHHLPDKRLFHLNGLSRWCDLFTQGWLRRVLYVDRVSWLDVTAWLQSLLYLSWTINTWSSLWRVVPRDVGVKKTTVLNYL